MTARNTTFKWLMALGCCLAMATTVGCSNSDLEDGGGDRRATSSAVKIKDFRFSPQTLEVSVGTQVTWVNNDKSDHSVTADNGAFDEILAPGQKFTHTFNKKGTFRYKDRLHSQPGLVAKIVVD